MDPWLFDELNRATAERVGVVIYVMSGKTLPRLTRSVPEVDPARALPAIRVQKPPVTASRIAALVVCTVAALGCGREIGDECQTAAECNPNGSRQCDVSQPGGYCTITGCDEKSCPEEAVCIRYFPTEFLTLPCNSCCEDRPAGSPLPPGCAEQGITCPDPPLDECTADQICLERVCAPRSTERRFCAKGCGSNDDCRGGYECRLAGTRGSLALTSTVGGTVRFCAPRTR